LLGSQAKDLIFRTNREKIQKKLLDRRRTENPWMVMIGESFDVNERMRRYAAIVVRIRKWLSLC